MGDSYFVDANYEAAVDAYTKSLSSNEDATLYQRRAAAYLALNKNMKALEDANRAIALDRSNYVAFYRKGLAALNLGELELATGCLNTASKLAKAADGGYLLPTLERWMERCAAELAIDDEEEEDDEEEDEDEEPEVTEVDTPPDLPPANDAVKAPVASPAPAPAPAPVPAPAPAPAPAPPVASAKAKTTVLYRHSFYQMSKTVVLSLFVPAPTPEGTQIAWSQQSLTVTIDRPTSYYHKEFYFFKAIKPNLCKAKFLSDRIEFKIKKAVKEKDDWKSLEGRKPVAAAAAAASSHVSAYASKKDWNRIDKICAEELEKDAEHEKGPAKFFREIYAKADDKTRMAMNKSYQMSGGTTLNCKWDEVEKKDFEKDRTAPKGAEWKRWDGAKS